MPRVDVPPIAAFNLAANFGPVSAEYRQYWAGVGAIAATGREYFSISQILTGRWRNVPANTEWLLE